MGGWTLTSPILRTSLPGGHSEREPPDPISNSEVKTLCADASVDFVDVKVGHCQALNLMKMDPHQRKLVGVFSYMAQPPRNATLCDFGALDSPRLSRD